MSRRRSVALILALVAALPPLGCRTAEPEPEGRPTSVLLVTLDTTRADRLGCYGNEQAITPLLDRMAHRGIVFDNATAVAPVTLPSHASILTGLYPPSHGALDNVDYSLSPEIPTLAEHLREHGYGTAAAIAAYVLAPETGLARGFQIYDAPNPVSAVASGNELTAEPIVERDATEITNMALAMLKRLPPQDSFFLWLHYFDPHADYDAPEPWASRAADAYDAEIAYVDAQLSRVIQFLTSQGRLDETLIVITADHGESLGEHGEQTHGLFAYESTLRVPLIIRPPNEIPGGFRSGRVVSGVDLVPTILEMIDLPPIEGAQGVSFAPTLLGRDQPPRGPVYAESRLPELAYGWSPLRVRRDGPAKLIDAPRPELYDLARDPDEATDLAAARSTEVNDALRELTTMRAAMPEPPEPTHDPADAVRRERLASLGYLSAGPATTRPGPASPDDPDPKDLVQLHNALLDAQVLTSAGRHDEALSIVTDVVGRDPANPAALSLHGTLLCRTGRCEEGLDRLIASATAQPRDYQTLHNLANAFDLAGRPAEAVGAYRAAIALRPDAAADRFGLGLLLYRGGDVDGAIESLTAALERGMDTARLHAALGIALSKTSRADEAMQSLARALDADPTLVDAWNAIGILSEKRGNPADALGHYTRALAIDADHADSLFNLARLSLQASRLDEADTAIGRLMSQRPDYPAARFIDAQIALSRGEQARARRSLERFLEGPPAPDPRLVDTARDQLAELDGS